MKKIVLSMMVVGALLATSCKGEKKEVKDAAKEVVTKVEKETEKVVEDTKKVVLDMVDSALEGVKIPTFSNEAVTENLKAYASYAKEYIDAKGNLAKITAMATKGADLLKKGKELAAKLDEKEMAKYKSVLSAIQSKMAPAK